MIWVLVARTTYEPHRSVTRGEAITLLWRYGGRPGVPPPPAYEPHTFTDTTPGAFYEPALNWAQAEGIITGYGGSHANPTNIYVPDGFLTRGEMVALIWRYAGSPPTSKAAPSSATGPARPLGSVTPVLRTSSRMPPTSRSPSRSSSRPTSRGTRRSPSTCLRPSRDSSPTPAARATSRSMGGSGDAARRHRGDVCDDHLHRRRR
jgi:hypothetical protein